MFQLTKFFVFVSLFYVLAFAAPYQELLPKPGYVPVYIREGDTPLSQINLKLAEAFHEDEELNQITLEPEAIIEMKVENSDHITQTKETNAVDKNLKENENENSNAEQKKIS